MPISIQWLTFPFPWTRNIMYMHEDLKTHLQDYKQAARADIHSTEKWYITVKGATKLSREFMLVSHKSYLSLVSSAASWTWWNGLLKYSQRSQHFKGFLEPTPLPCITPGEGEKRGPKRNGKGTQETASKRENTLKPKCKRVIGAEMSRETLTEKKKLKMKEHGVPKKPLFWADPQIRWDKSTVSSLSACSWVQAFLFPT